MSKRVVIHQPDFLPHVSFFHRFLKVDLWVVLDNVQFVHKSSRSWNNRDKIKTLHGEKWITVAVEKCPLKTAINEVRLSKEGNWREANLASIRQNYKDAVYFNEIYPYIAELYGFRCEKMVDFNMRSIEMLLKLLNIKMPYIFASELKPEGKKNDLLINILKKVDGSIYLSGPGARDYLEQKPFDDAGIKVVWQDFSHPAYPQLYGDFIPYLSSIDMLFNCGIEKSRETLRRC